MSTNGIEIGIVDYMGFFIPKSSIEGFSDTYFANPVLDENGLCDKCRPFGYCIDEDKSLTQ